LGQDHFISSESAINIPVEMIHYGVTKPMQSPWRAGSPKQRQYSR